MFEAERVLMTDNVVIPIYTYVTKRLVDPHLRGWHNNVMDHHPTRNMFKLKSRRSAYSRDAEMRQARSFRHAHSPAGPDSNPAGVDHDWLFS